MWLYVYWIQVWDQTYDPDFPEETEMFIYDNGKEWLSEEITDSYDGMRATFYHVLQVEHGATFSMNPSQVVGTTCWHEAISWHRTLSAMWPFTSVGRSAPPGIRTRNLRIKSPLLCH